MNYELEYKNKDGEYDYIDVDFDANFYAESTGIGSYEYWGFKGYDKGENYFSCDDVRWDKSLYTEEQNAIIQKHLDENHEKIENLLIENYSKADY
jgi:hypothetical protein